ncbi:MAG: hypothetical protein DPW18_13875 [Chloroflexi bacterium]|nr:hypothetical protein [Chloroflexota bacterium]MDL1942897.1 hypothetical protein [Chloroflexi bacterium CFX2]
MNLEHPERLIAIAIGMMLFGCVMPFLMVIHVVESTIFLNFLSYTLSVLGLFLGITGVAMLRAKQRRNSDDEDRYR